MVASGVRWGATLGESTVRLGGPVREWTVTVESEPLGSLVGDAALSRFSEAALRSAPDAGPACLLRGDRLGMTLTVRAPELDEAADSGAHAFARALGAALWPRYIPSPVGQWRVRVTPADPALAVS